MGQLGWLIFLVPFIWHLFAHIIPMLRDEVEQDKRDKAMFDEAIKRNSTIPKH